MNISAQTHSPGPTDTGRLVSLDVFRGATIAWMILVNSVIHGGPDMGPFAHGKWNQITPTDWVFPFFLFIMGVAIPFRKLKGSNLFFLGILFCEIRGRVAASDVYHQAMVLVS